MWGILSKCLDITNCRFQSDSLLITVLHITSHQWRSISLQLEALLAAHLTVQPCTPELWIHAKGSAVQGTVQVVPVLPDEMVYHGLLGSLQAESIHIVLEEAAVEAHLQQEVVMARHGWP